MKDLRQMAEMGASMKEIVEYANAELEAAAAIIKEKKENAEKAARQKHAIDILIDATISYAKAFNLIAEDEEVTPESKEALAKIAASALPGAINPQPAKTTKEPSVVEVELDEKELDDLIKKIFG
jgi:hypothetical protein